MAIQITGHPEFDQVTFVDIAQYSNVIVQIEGIVSPSEQFIYYREKKPDVHSFFLSVWRIVASEKIFSRKLSVSRPITHAQAALKEIPADAFVLLNVRLNLDKDRSVLVQGEIVDTVHANLAVVAERLAKPKIIQSELFGNLTFDGSISWYVGMAEWKNEMIELNFPVAEKDRNVDKGLQTASELWRDQAGWHEKIVQFAAKKLLKLKNKHWLEQEQTPLTIEDFIRCMTIQSVTIEKSGRFVFWFEDGGLFGGHSIAVNGNVKKGLSNAEMG